VDLAVDSVAQPKLGSLFSLIEEGIEVQLYTNNSALGVIFEVLRFLENQEGQGVKIAMVWVVQG
jgi:hypothetical protein